MATDDTTTPLLNSSARGAKRFKLSKWTPIEILVVLYFLAASCLWPVQQYYAITVIAEKHNVSNFINHEEKSCHSPSTNSSNNPKILVDKIEKESSQFLMYLGFCGTFLSVIPILCLGSISDRLGRKFVLCFCLAGLLLKEIIYLVVIYFHLSLYILYLAQVIEGLTGGFGGMLMALFGMTADVTEPGKNRAFRLSVVEGTASITYSLATLGMGYWIKYGNFYFPLIFISVMTILTIAFCVLFIPETSPMQGRNETFSLVYFFKCFRFYVLPSPEGRRRKLTASLFILALSGAAILGRSSTLTLYLLKSPICWNEVKVQIFTSVQTFANWVAAMVVVRILHVFTQDYVILVIGTLSAASASLLLAFATKDWLVYLFVIVGICSAAVFPTVRAMMSRQCTAAEQGSLFASVASVELLFTAFAQLTYGGVYKASVSFYPGLVFLIMGGVLFIVLIISLTLFRWMRKENLNIQTWQVIN
ncbi:proton-coupled folate transporter-like [Mytilus edulis]|uniref:proton-coupled folate transporter-like n=1 Tax=Mytilus edulis TaxID=6550 RepID=UPI0039F076DC